jgi:hypothetical protein
MEILKTNSEDLIAKIELQIAGIQEQIDSAIDNYIEGEYPHELTTLRLQKVWLEMQLANLHTGLNSQSINPITES